MLNNLVKFKDRNVGLAVSGGPDSIALMLAFHEYRPDTFQVVTVDHGFRTASAMEVQFVRQLCDERSIPCNIITLGLKSGSGNQERARMARYSAMAAWAKENDLAALVTGHHANDQAETMIMRLNRGVGIKGLGGMREISTTPCGFPLWRPFLNVRRDELVEYVMANGIVPINDPSNQDEHYERVRIRNAMTEVFDPLGFAKTAQILESTNNAIEWMVDQVWDRVELSSNEIKWKAEPIPEIMQHRILERVLDHFGKRPKRGGAIPVWLNQIKSCGSASLAGVIGNTRKPVWTFKPERA